MNLIREILFSGIIISYILLSVIELTKGHLRLCIFWLGLALVNGLVFSEGKQW